MNICSAHTSGAFLCLCLLVASAGCSSDPADTDAPDTGGYIDADADTGEPDTGEPDTGEPGDGSLVLEGHLAPSGGMSMSSSFTLSGGLAPNMPATVSSSASFRLEQTPPTIGVD